jgi:hypothetical protein
MLIGYCRCARIAHAVSGYVESCGARTFVRSSSAAMLRSVPTRRSEGNSSGSPEWQAYAYCADLSQCALARLEHPWPSELHRSHCLNLTRGLRTRSSTCKTAATSTGSSSVSRRCPRQTVRKRPATAALCSFRLSLRMAQFPSASQRRLDASRCRKLHPPPRHDFHLACRRSYWGQPLDGYPLRLGALSCVP